MNPLPQSMKTAASLFTSLGLLSLGLMGCAQDTQGAPEDAVAQVEDEPELAPAPARLPERAKEMWEHKQAGDWIQVYDFLAPEYKRAVPLGKFLRGKENHIYEDASNPHVLKIEGDRGFVEIHVQWTPTHPILSTVDNGGGSLTEILDEVDEWVWTDGEWWLAQQHRVSELRKTHPHLWASGEQG